jgi:hypothetical protein
MQIAIKKINIYKFKIVMENKSPLHKRRKVMYYNFNFGISNTDIQLAKELEGVLDEQNIKVVESRGFLGNTEIIVAIIAATPIILTQIASIIKKYMDRNKSKSLKLKIGDQEVSFSGYSLDEVEEVFKRINKNV